VVTNGIDRALSHDRSELSKPKVKTGDEIIPFVHTFNSANPNIMSNVMNGLNILAPSQRMQETISNKHVVAARRQPLSLKGMLFHPQFESSSSPSQGGITACRDLTS
jgi:hypothetical protein